MRGIPRPVGLLTTGLLLTGCSVAGTSADGAVPRPASGSPPAGTPELRVDVVADGLDHPWDVAQAPDGTLLVDERSGGLTAVRPDGSVTTVEADFGDLYARGETGLTGLTLDPAFGASRRFYTCQGVRDGADPSVAVIAWTVDPDWTVATRTADPLLGGIAASETSGRHGGCRLRFAPDGALLVSAGDATIGSQPQDLAALGGKVLRIDAATGRPAPGNPFAERPEPASAFVWTYGHRNVQGLAVRPGTGQVFAVEHGPDRDDEINLLRPGGNYGWDPAGDDDGDYDESVPMTDRDIAGAVPAVWSSGQPTVAPSGATFLDGDAWGDYDGLLLVGLLKDRGVLAPRLDEAGPRASSFRLPELEGRYGRIRTVQQAADGALYVTTDNGDDADQLLRVTPAG